MYKLRPHHSLCMQFFIGKGYSADFTENMYKMLSLPPETEINVTFSLDSLCGKCPNHPDGDCLSESKVSRIDKTVSEICGFSEGDRLSFGDFIKTARERIVLTEKLFSVCGDCEFSGICLAEAEKIPDKAK